MILGRRFLVRLGKLKAHLLVNSPDLLMVPSYALTAQIRKAQAAVLTQLFDLEHLSRTDPFGLIQPASCNR